MQPSNLERARRFLAHHRIAVVGVSRNAHDFSRALLRELAARGYDVVPVSPALVEADGVRAAASVKDVAPRAEAALLLTPPGRTLDVARECVEAGVRTVWMHRGGGHGSATPEAVALCEASGVEVVTDLCPFMALPGASFPHRVHGRLRSWSLARRARA